MKRIISLLLVLVHLLIPISVHADSPTFVIKTPTGAVQLGAEFTVTVSLTGNPGFNALQYTLSFDKNAMECTYIELGSILRGSFSATNESGKNGANIAAAKADVMNGDGIIATYSFKAKKNISTFSFELTNMVFSTDSGDDIQYTTKAEGTVTDPGSQGTGSDAGLTPTGGGTEGGKQETQVSTEVFTDVSGHWAESFIYGAVEKKLFGGYGNGKFGPDDKITRAQFITVLWRMAGKPECKETTPFTDIANQSDEFKEAIAWGYSKKIINGKSTTHFDPEGTATRQEIVKMLYYYNGAKSGMELMFTSAYDSAYTDMIQVESWAKPAMYWAIYNTILTGKTSTTLCPLDTTTRAEVAKILLTYSGL